MKAAIIAIMTVTSLFSGCKGSKDATSGTVNTTNESFKEVVEINGGGESEMVNVRTGKKAMTDIVGEWEWVKTVCCGRMRGETYPKQGKPVKTISFTAEGRAVYYTSGEKDEVSEVPYTFGSLGEQVTIKIGELTPALIVIADVKGVETLVLDWGYIDLQTEYYKRVK